MTATNSPVHNTATAQANLETGEIEAFAVFYTSAERLFRALTTKEICNWWVRPGVFNTQEWSGDLREGGRWAAAGIGGGKPYQLDGEFVTVDAPYQLSHTWRSVGAPGGPSLVTYGLATHGDGVHLTLRHTGLMNPDICEKTRAGWETSFARLQEITQAEKR